jgi:prepilin-type processing-associated H-X9-DG protein
MHIPKGSASVTTGTAAGATYYQIQAASGNVLYPISYAGGGDSKSKQAGIFFEPNQSTGFQSIVDGTSNTIMTGELQRITTVLGTGQSPNSTTGPFLSHDGWAAPCDATLFSTSIGTSNSAGPLMNNGNAGAPGSEHSGTVNFGLGDGSVRSLSVSMDPNTFALLGSMADRMPVSAD